MKSIIRINFQFNLLAAKCDLPRHPLEILLIEENWIRPRRWMILHNSFAFMIFLERISAKIRKILSRKIFGNCILCHNPSARVEWNAIKCEITWVARNHKSNDGSSSPENSSRCCHKESQNHLETEPSIKSAMLTSNEYVNSFSSESNFSHRADVKVLFFAAATDTLSCMISMRNFAISAKSA